ncbi:hypothetical protein N5B55_05080 [Ralstonia pickettii]|uniref:hypothetical protein n=1 Tax=Ralstonia pickettii TaxID=329 RepID=UPI002714F109|nr:hypothetical protein [Ralstonia pickettii]WKZ86328.1 hypothetical protein N5B55_05080 [Ralstonia pickettii]
MASRKKWPRLVTVDVPLFSGRVCVTTSRADYEAAARYLGDCGEELQEAIWGALGLTSTYAHLETGEPMHLVGVFDGKPRTLVHELAHVAFDVLDRVGQETDRGGRETFCYLQDYLFERFESVLLTPAEEPEPQKREIAHGRR